MEDKNKKLLISSSIVLAAILILVLIYFISPKKCKDISSSSTKSFQVIMVTDGSSLHDGSFQETVWNGLVRVNNNPDMHIKASYIETSNDAGIEAGLLTAAEKANLVIGCGAIMTDPMIKASTNNPNTKFLAVDDQGDIPTNELPANLKRIRTKVQGPSFLAGILAGKNTKTGKIGIMMGKDIAIIHEFVYGFMAGAKSVNPSVKFNIAVMNSFSDIQKYIAMTRQMIADNCDMILPVSGPCASAVFTAVRECPKKIYVFGVDADQSSMAPDNLLASIVKRLDVIVEKECQVFESGKFEGRKLEIYDLSSGGVDVVINKPLVSEEMQNLVESVRKKLNSGEIKASSSKEEYDKNYATLKTPIL